MSDNRKFRGRSPLLSAIGGSALGGGSGVAENEMFGMDEETANAMLGGAKADISNPYKLDGNVKDFFSGGANSRQVLALNSANRLANLKNSLELDTQLKTVEAKAGAAREELANKTAAEIAKENRFYGANTGPQIATQNDFDLRKKEGLPSNSNVTNPTFTSAFENRALTGAKESSDKAGAASAKANLDKKVSEVSLTRAIPDTNAQLDATRAANGGIVIKNRQEADLDKKYGSNLLEQERLADVGNKLATGNLTRANVAESNAKTAKSNVETMLLERKANSPDVEHTSNGWVDKGLNLRFEVYSEDKFSDDPSPKIKVFDTETGKEVKIKGLNDTPVAPKKKSPALTSALIQD